MDPLFKGQGAFAIYYMTGRNKGTYNKQGVLHPKLWEFSSKQMLKPMGYIKVKG